MSINSTSDIDELNKTKLALEIAELGRPAWQRPAFITPVIAAILSLALAHFSGWFDLQSTRLEIQRSKLTKDVEKFENERSTVKAEVQNLRTELEGATKKLENASNELLEMRRKHELANNELRDVTRKLTDANKELSQLEAKYMANLNSIRRENRDKAAAIASLRTELRAVRSRNDSNAITRIETKLKEMEDSLKSTKTEELRTIARIKELTERDVLMQQLRESGVRLDDDGCFIVDEGPAKGEQHCTNL